MQRTGGRRERSERAQSARGETRVAFASTDHLAADAVVAYVDGVLPGGAYARAEAHLRECGRCATEVAAQFDARTLLRGCGDVCAPPSLIGELTQIPTREFDVRDVQRRSR